MKLEDRSRKNRHLKTVSPINRAKKNNDDHNERNFLIPKIKLEERPEYMNRSKKSQQLKVVTSNVMNPSSGILIDGGLRGNRYLERDSDLYKRDPGIVERAEQNSREKSEFEDVTKKLEQYLQGNNEEFDFTAENEGDDQRESAFEVRSKTQDFINFTGSGFTTSDNLQNNQFGLFYEDGKLHGGKPRALMSYDECKIPSIAGWAGQGGRQGKQAGGNVQGSNKERGGNPGRGANKKISNYKAQTRTSAGAHLEQRDLPESPKRSEKGKLSQLSGPAMKTQSPILVQGEQPPRSSRAQAKAVPHEGPGHVINCTKSVFLGNGQAGVEPKMTPIRSLINTLQKGRATHKSRNLHQT